MTGSAGRPRSRRSATADRGGRAAVTQRRTEALRAQPLRAQPLRAAPRRAAPLRAQSLRANGRRSQPLRAQPLPASLRAPDAMPEPARSASTLRRLAEIPLLALLAVVVTLVVKATLAQAFYIPSASMEPQLREHDRVVVSRLAYRLHDPRRGDIVVFTDPSAPTDERGLVQRWVGDLLETVAIRRPSDDQLIKRVVALPGETIAARGGRVVIDGRLLDEPYTTDGTDTADFGPITVPDDHVFVMGDNRSDSHDSRFADVGPIPHDDIIGRALLRAWPPSRWAYL